MIKLSVGLPYILLNITQYTEYLYTVYTETYQPNFLGIDSSADSRSFDFKFKLMYGTVSYYACR